MEGRRNSKKRSKPQNNFYTYLMGVIVKPKGLKASIVFIKDIAVRFHDVRYYINRGYEEKNLVQKEREKTRYSTPKQDKITEILMKYRELGKRNVAKANKTLRSIAVKNIGHMLDKKDPPVHTNIMGLITSVPLLVQAYTKIRTNRGALTAAAGMSTEQWNNLSTYQKRYLRLTRKTSDGISMETFHLTSQILRKGLYPWGTSKRIYIPKPGVLNKKRPITIPPFMDKVVQQNIKVILETIYEPWFDKTNCSFGFRPGKSTHSAITAIASSNRSFHHAIEGDVEAAYDRVNKEKLLAILGKRIKDATFMKLMRQRLNYTFLDTDAGKYETPSDGVPQGGIDSPYLFNIYMKEYDDWIVEHLEQLSKKINTTLRTNKHTNNGLVREGTIPQIKEKTALMRRIKSEKKKIVMAESKEQKYEIIRNVRKLQHAKRQMPSRDINRELIEFRYFRYADDWIILNNANALTNVQLKKDIQNWLKTNLDATLSESKTLITDIRKTPAKYLGFELTLGKNRKLAKKKNPKVGRLVLSKVAGHRIRIYPDANRLINRCFMKGYCNEKGHPKEIPWLSVIEPYMIIDKYNAVIRGFAQFYTEFISNKRAMTRWIYIYRFSCIKTLAQKYKTTTRKIFERFATRDPQFRRKYGKTVEIKVRIKYKDKKTYEKTYRLMTYLEAIDAVMASQQKDKYERIHKKLSYIHDKKIDDYFDLTQETTDMTPASPNYLDRIKWVNWRTLCSQDMPCRISGYWKGMSSQMHHIRHVRKR